MFEGSIVALVTPFKNGKIDEKAVGDLVEFQVANRTDGIAVCGTTGEAATLTHEEHQRVVELTVEAAARRVTVLAGTGSNSTDEAVALTRHAKRVGADGALLITPYYNKPTQEGLYLHFRQIAEAVEIPVVLYNIPGRTAVNMTTQTVERLSHIKTIVGIKEGSGSLHQAMEIIATCGPQFSVISGDDALTIPFMALGGTGVIAVTSNLVPGDMADLCHAAAAGDWPRARQVHYKLLPLFDCLFLETNPIPVKTAMGLVRRCSPELRLPLTPPSEATAEAVRKALKAYGLL